MSEETGVVSMPPKGIGTVNWKRDLLKGLYYACAGQIIAILGFVGTSILKEQPHFPNTWVEWLPYVKGLIYTAAGYIGAKFGVNNVGQLFQKDKPVLLVAKEHLKDLTDKAAANTDTTKTE